MKASTITIIAAVLTLHTGLLFAGNENISSAVINEATTISMEFLAPVAPAEATFEDFNIVNEVTSLAPVMPSEATFEEMPVDATSVFDLAPVAPIRADFDDAVGDNSIDISSLAPVTPIVADFE